MRILVVEDDQPLMEAIVNVLKDEFYEVDLAENGTDGLYLAESSIHDLIVLDVMLPGMNGIAIVQRLRKLSNAVPILLVTAKDAVEDRVKGLDAGADDYLVKPFAVEELLARIRALLRRHGKLGLENECAYGPIYVDFSKYDVLVHETPLNLTLKEYELLKFLVTNAEQILTREQIFDRIWGFQSDAVLNIVDVYVHHVRRKLAQQECGEYIQTVRGVGYMLKGNVDV
jgi:two-component system, OmpR family, response regulator CiaR